MTSYPQGGKGGTVPPLPTVKAAGRNSRTRSASFPFPHPQHREGRSATDRYSVSGRGEPFPLSPLPVDKAKHAITTARCPACGAVCWPTWLITHRPGCEYDAVDSTQWPIPGSHPGSGQPERNTHA